MKVTAPERRIRKSRDIHSKKKNQPEEATSALAAAFVEAALSKLTEDPGPVEELAGRDNELFDAVVGDTMSDQLQRFKFRIIHKWPEAEKLVNDLISEADGLAWDFQKQGYVLGVAVGRRIGGVR